MEQIKESITLEKEILELVLKEMLEEQQKSNLVIANQSLMIEALINKINAIDENTRKNKPVNPTLNLKPIEDLIQNAVGEIEVKALAQPKIIKRQFQVLLFPPQDARLFYKIVFGRWLLLLVIMLLITDLYKWGIHWSDNQKEIKQHQLENDRIRKAWNYLYFQKGISIKRLMDSAYRKSFNKY